MKQSDLLSRLADLTVRIGANVQPGQIVSISAHLGQHDFVRALAESAYRAGAKFVDVSYFDPHVKRARIELADEDTLGFVPSWYREGALEVGRQRAARISLAGTIIGAAPPDGLDPRRAGKDQLPALREVLEVINERLVNWTIVPCPTLEWARLCYPSLDDDAALERLWEEVAYVCRLDEPDPATAWKAHISALAAVAVRLDGLSLDAIHFEGPGTDLTVGLLPTSRFMAAITSTVDDVEHLPNIPTEEVFTTPDPERADGRVRATKPLTLVDGTSVSGLEVRFEAGRAVEIEAEAGGEILRERVAAAAGASRLGEVALVDRESRIGRLGTIFYETLLDENAASHVALGDGLPECVGPEDMERVNVSDIHVDFMIGGDDVDVTGIARDGRRVPLLRGGSWAI